MIEIIKNSIERAERNESKLTKEILQIDGMSSSKIRHLLNNICSQISDTSYLEIGCYKGSTFISAAYKNNLDLIGIDNWSEFGDHRNEFYSNVKRFLELDRRPAFVIYESDAFQLDLQDMKDHYKKVGVYFYDGNHSRESQKKAFTYYNEVFEDVFIAIIDDWNFELVRLGTQDAFDELKYHIINEWTLSADYNGDVNKYWNGLHIVIIQK